jgi:hypothetical protein
MSPQCAVCGENCKSKRGLQKYYQQNHSGEVWPDDEDLPDDPPPQRDFEGNGPDDSDYNPEYETTNDPPETRKGRLTEWEREQEESDE